MKKNLLFLLMLLFPSLSLAGKTLPQTLLMPVYQALLTQKNDKAWQRLLSIWPQLSSDAQRAAWEQALTALISNQCGNDLPIQTPAWLDHPTLVFLQRDMPLNRIYRLQLRGNSLRHDLQASLTLPNGEVVSLNTETEFFDKTQFQLTSAERGEKLPAGVFHLIVTSGHERWSTSLAIQRSGNADWIQLRGHHVQLSSPVTPKTCPAPWVEQSLFRRDNYARISWQKHTEMKLHPWAVPPQSRPDTLWGSISLIRKEARGGLTLHFEHRLAGLLSTLQP